MTSYFDIGVLEGSLVRLEPLDFRHVDALVDAAAEGPDRYVLTDVPADRSQAEAYVRRAVDGRHTDSIITFAIVDRRADRVVGSTRFCSFEYWRWRAVPDTAGGHPRRR